MKRARSRLRRAVVDYLHASALLRRAQRAVDDDQMQDDALERECERILELWHAAESRLRSAILAITGGHSKRRDQDGRRLRRVVVVGRFSFGVRSQGRIRMAEVVEVVPVKRR